MIKKFKYPLLCAMLLLFSISNAQQKQDKIQVSYSSESDSHTSFHSSPIYYIDSVEIKAASIGFFNPDDIASINVVQEGPGKIYLSLKKDLKHQFLTLKQLSEKYLKPSAAENLYLIDDMLVKSDNMMIDENYILSIHVTEPENLPQLKGTQFHVIQIRTKNKQNLEKAGNIRIRGTNNSK